MPNLNGGRNGSRSNRIQVKKKQQDFLSMFFGFSFNDRLYFESKVIRLYLCYVCKKRECIIPTRKAFILSVLSQTLEKEDTMKRRLY